MTAPAEQSTAIAAPAVVHDQNIVSNPHDERGALLRLLQSESTASPRAIMVQASGTANTPAGSARGVSSQTPSTPILTTQRVTTPSPPTPRHVDGSIHRRLDTPFKDIVAAFADSDQSEHPLDVARLDALPSSPSPFPVVAENMTATWVPASKPASVRRSKRVKSTKARAKTSRSGNSLALPPCPEAVASAISRASPKRGPGEQS